jgi:hypothetical protein
MTRLFCVVMVLAVACLGTSAAWASVPSEENSECVLSGLICSSTKGLLCPAGDGTSMTVTVRDQFNAPMAFVQVQVNVTTSCVLASCVTVPMVGTTDVNGVVGFTFPMGLAYADDNCCELTVTVTCLGVTICTDVREWLSSDFNGDLQVENLDTQAVYNNWDPAGTLGPFCRSDSNCDGLVEYLDEQGLINNHWLHVCP